MPVNYSTDKNIITVSDPEYSVFGFSILLLLSVISGIIVLILIITGLVTGFDIISVIVICVLLGCSIYMIRMLLWIRYGKEILDISDKNRLIYIADYGYFKDTQPAISLSDLNIEFVSVAEDDKITLLFYKDQQKIHTVHPLSLAEAQQVKTVILSYSGH